MSRWREPGARWLAGRGKTIRRNAHRSSWAAAAKLARTLASRRQTAQSRVRRCSRARRATLQRATATGSTTASRCSTIAATSTTHGPTQRTTRGTGTHRCLPPPEARTTRKQRPRRPTRTTKATQLATLTMERTATRLATLMVERMARPHRQTPAPQRLAQRPAAQHRSRAYRSIFPRRRGHRREILLRVLGPLTQARGRCLLPRPLQASCLFALIRSSISKTQTFVARHRRHAFPFSYAHASRHTDTIAGKHTCVCKT